MVGHTGVWNAIIKAVETVDQYVEATIKAALSLDYTVFLTADHGNADYAINTDGSPNTAHTLNPVPLFIIDNHWSGTITDGKLADIAPTILQFMGLTQPLEMTGNILIQPIH
jgi:2,3-bisphosphoglycerate-independent phosphoglycerate mutase